MQLALHAHHILDHFRIQCTLCRHFEGDMAGGPYTLELRDMELDGDTLLELRASDGTFRLVCGMISLLGHQRELRGSELITV